VRQLHQAGIRAEAIHGNKSQNARQRALGNFKSGKTHVLIASDVAARGIDVDDISHVINYDLTHEPETYVHRIGRTARAGADGHAISFCDADERANLRAIESLIRKSIRVNEDQPAYAPAVKTHASTQRPRHHATSHGTAGARSRPAGAHAPVRAMSQHRQDRSPQTPRAAHPLSGKHPVSARRGRRRRRRTIAAW
jgi:ATP-dependent RNA helicase RhlE